MTAEHIRRTEERCDIVRAALAEFECLIWSSPDVDAAVRLIVTNLDQYESEERPFAVSHSVRELLRAAIIQYEEWIRRGHEPETPHQMASKMVDAIGEAFDTVVEAGNGR